MVMPVKIPIVTLGVNGVSAMYLLHGALTADPQF